MGCAVLGGGVSVAAKHRVAIQAANRPSARGVGMPRRPSPARLGSTASRLSSFQRGRDWYPIVMVRVQLLHFRDAQKSQARCLYVLADLTRWSMPGGDLWRAMPTS